ncbi:hypothetical protein [Nocardia spumae]|uniref:TPR repeat region-containing protein n=1 Tax=Nocardia spumae TaxID=2887190 RepID=UPI001D13AF52|nr:hypothetical protein [Nocardia spumae]
MSLLPDQIRAWRPHDLVEVATEWNTLADKLDQKFTDYHDALIRTSDGGYWEGAGADAAQQSALDDRKHIGEATEAVRGLARLLNDQWYGIEAPLQRAKTALDALAREGFPLAVSAPVADHYEISDNTVISGKPWGELDAAKKAEIQQLLFDLTDGAAAAKSANDALCNQLNTAAAGLPAQFTSASALGTDQAKADATDLAAGTMSPDDIARLIDAGQLSPEQLADLQSGGAATIPASQMQYLTELSRSLDGKSPQEIAQIMDKLPPDGRQALANAFQLVSNERVDGGSAGKGNFDKLPKEVRDSLTRKDLVSQDYTSRTKSINLNGVADNQTIANIVAAGDDRYKQGSTLDNHLMDVGRQYLDAQVKHEQNPHKNLEALTADGYVPTNGRVTEPIFQAVGPDKFAVEAAVTDKAHGKDFVTDVMTHEWSDDGKAASSMFKFNDGDAVVTDPSNRADVATATRAGHIMSKFGEYASTEDQWKKFADVGGNQSAGERNPDLVRQLSHSMSPYIDSLAGQPREELPGFRTRTDDGKSWIDPADNQTYEGSERMFALMNTDKEAGEQFTGAAIDRILQNEAEYARDPHRPDADSDLATAGRINALSDRGLQDGIQASNENKHDIAKEAYDRKARVYDALKAGTQFGLTMTGTTNPEFAPVTEATKSIIDGGGDSLKSAIIGSAPGDTENAKLVAPNFSQRNYEVLSRMEIPPEVQKNYSILFDHGVLKPWTVILGDGSYENRDRSDVVDKMMSEVGNPQVFRNAYDDVTRTAARPK